MVTKVPLRIDERIYPVGTKVTVDDDLSTHPFHLHCTFPDGKKAVLKRGTEIDIETDLPGGFFPISV